MIDKIKTYIKSKGIEEYDIFFAEGDTLTVGSRGKDIGFANRGLTYGLGIRVIQNKKIGFASTSNIQNFQKCINKAVKISKLNTKDNKFERLVSPKKCPKVRTFDRKLLSFNEIKVKHFLEDYRKSILEAHPKIKISRSMYEKYLYSKHIVNSEGIDLKSKKVAHQYDIEIIYPEGNSIWYDEEASKLFKPSTGKKMGKYLLSLEKKEKLKTGNFPVILHPEALKELMGQTFTYSINQENINHKKSIFTTKLNQEVLNKKISISDNALVPNMLGSREHDCEGTPSRKNILIQKGVFKGSISDSYNAFQIKKQSTGNASRSYASTPSISSTNIIMAPGNTDLKEMIGSIKYGAIIRNFAGIHTMDSVTGNFSQGVNAGHIIENGKVTKSIADSMVAGNMYDALKQKILISKQLIEKGTYKLPYVLIPKLSLIGK